MKGWSQTLSVTGWLLLEGCVHQVLRRNGPQNFDELNISQSHPEVVQSLSQVLQGLRQVSV